MMPETDVLVQVFATVFSVLGSLWWLDRKITGTRQELQTDIKSLDTKHSAEIKEVRLASENAHKDILAQLSDIRIQQATHTERFNCIEKHLNLSRDDGTE